MLKVVKPSKETKSEAERLFCLVSAFRLQQKRFPLVKITCPFVKIAP